MIIVLILLVVALIVILKRIDRLEKTFIECFWSNLDKDFKDVVE